MRRKVGDSVVVITGATSGIGRATALACAERGAAVVLSGRREAALNDLVRKSEDIGGRAIAFPADVNDPDAMEQLAESAVNHFGRIDVWFNNAAVTVAGRFDEIPPDVYRQVIETNLFGTINGCRAVLPYLREQGSGTLINHSSVVGTFGASMFSAYSASKFAIRGFTQTLRQELRGTGIDVRLVLPAAIDTPIYNQAANFSGFEIKPVDPVYPAELAASTVVSLIERPRPEAIVGNAGVLGSLVRTIAPYSISDRIIGNQWETEHFKPVAADPSTGNVFEPDLAHPHVSGGWARQRTSSAPYIAAFAILATPAVIWWGKHRISRRGT
jgi:NAD(P)-dependent dehydrogenase (short-subunit alcohol dehydrogenase family)